MTPAHLWALAAAVSALGVLLLALRPWSGHLDTLEEVGAVLLAVGVSICVGALVMESVG